MVFTGLLLCRLICFPTLCCSDYDDFPDFVLRRLWWFFPTLCCADYDDFPDFVRRRLWWYFPDFVLRRLWWFSPTLCCADNADFDRICSALTMMIFPDFVLHRLWWFSRLCAAPTMMIFPTLCCADYDVWWYLTIFYCGGYADIYRHFVGLYPVTFLVSTNQKDLSTWSANLKVLLKSLITETDEDVKLGISFFQVKEDILELKPKLDYSLLTNKISIIYTCKY